MFCDIEDERLYAEIEVPEEGDFSEDYGYFTLKAGILKQVKKFGIDPERLRFWYDGQEQFLAPDAHAE